MNKSIIKLKNSIDELTKLSIAIENLAEEWKLPITTAMNLNLVLEEIFTNIVNYGFEDTQLHFITIEFNFEETLKIIISDDGIAFNPLIDARKPDLNADVETRKIGGLGIHIVKKIMDKVDYKRIQNKNILKLYKEVKK